LIKTVIPTKMLEFMSCARPVILGVDGQARWIVEEARAGIYVEPENATALSDAVLELLSKPELCTKLGENGRKYILAKFSRRKTAERYLDVLGRVVGIQAQEETPVCAR
jgi:glycosyltransferase involved in cell wall biosynthesis